MPWVRLVFNAIALAGGLGLAVWTLAGGLEHSPLPYRSLAQGRALSETGSIPTRELLVYTAQPGQGFDTRSWVLDVISFQAAKAWGLRALRILDLLALALGLFGLAAACFRRGARPFTGALCLVAVAWLLRDRLQSGAGLWAWALACASLACLEGAFWEAFFGRWVYLAPIALLWVNIHPSAWGLAPLLLAWVSFEGQGADPLRPPQAGFAKVVALILLGVLLCLSPAPWDSFRQGWQALGASPLLPANFEHDQTALLGLAFAFFVLVASSWTPEGRPSLARDAAIMGSLGLLSLLSRDALPFALAYAVPMTALRTDALVDALPAPLQSLRWPAKVLGVLALGLSLVPGIGQGRWATRLAPSVPPLPKKVLAFYEHELLNAKLLCPPEWAGLLEWRLAPNVLLALDDRGAAVSGAQAARSLQETLRAEGAWRETLLGAQVEACLLPLGSPLSLALARAAEWQPVAFDDVAVLYVRSLPPMAELIHAQAPRGLRPGDPAQPFDPGRIAQAEADLEARLEHDPDLGVLHFYAAELALAKGQSARARQSLEQGIRKDPDFAPNYLRLAALRQAAGMEAQAQPLLERAKTLALGADWCAALARLGAD